MSHSKELENEKLNQKYLFKKICPVCMSVIKNFVPISKFYTDNLDKYGFRYTFNDFETLNANAYSCPKCNSSDRDRLYAVYIKSKFSNHEYIEKLNNFDLSKTNFISKIIKRIFPLRYKYKSIKLVDFAPSNPLSNYIKDLNIFDYKTADLYMKNVDNIINIEDMKYESNSFDYFICSHVLEHVDDQKALNELYRILKTGGWGILMTPICLAIDKTLENIDDGSEEQRWSFYGQNDHLRLYSKSGFLSKVKNVGFIIEELNINYFGKNTFNMFGINNKSVLYIVHKKR